MCRLHLLLVASSLLLLLLPTSYSLSPTPYTWLGEGNQTNAHFGAALSTAGDVNGDGYGDLIVGAPGYGGGRGAAFVYPGGPGGLGVAAWSVIGPLAGSRLGSAVSLAGDVNGDGYADVAIGAPGSGEGTVFVYYGGAAGLASGAADWSAAGRGPSGAGDVNGDGYDDLLVVLSDGTAAVYHGSAGGVLTSTACSLALAAAVELAVAAGDVNDDGYGDVLVGAPDADLYETLVFTDAGLVAVYYGGAAGLVTGTAQFLWGDRPDARLGVRAAGVGDVNGDGYADVVVGGGDGRAFLHYGGADGLRSPGVEIAPCAAVSLAGDVNGDGYADVLAAPGDGTAALYYGGAGGLSPAPARTFHPDGSPGAAFGAALAVAGDVNGDGFSDLAIGAPDYDHGESDEGGVFVYHGGPDGLATAPALTTPGDQRAAQAGHLVAAAGDVNGDGYGDLLVGAPRHGYDRPEEGATFLYLGGPGGPDARPAWQVSGGQAWAWFGYAVAAAGDVNGDGYGDILIGAPRFDIETVDDGRVFVYHGGPDGLSDSPDWVAPRVPLGVSARFGIAVAAAGDVNGDGYGDAIIGANGYDAEKTNEGAAFVYHGGPGGLSADPAWVVHPTDQAYANFGRSVAAAGDVNGDGYGDVIIGAPWRARSKVDPRLDGAAYVYHGSSTGLRRTPAWTPREIFQNAQFGIAVTAAGDVNGDGYGDVAVGAFEYTAVLYQTPWREGAVFVYHGGPTGLNADAANWRAVSGQEQAKFGLSVAGIGDVNGDGYGDLAVGAPGYRREAMETGAVFVYYGSAAGLRPAESGWFAAGEQERAGYGFSLAAGGDVDGDGDGDMIVGAPAYNAGASDTGAAYIYLGEGGAGWPTRPRQMHIHTAAPVALSGRSDSANQVRLWLGARSPLGREAIGAEWQVTPAGAPFAAAPLWAEADCGVECGHVVEGLSAGRLYRWRVRLVYRPGNRLGQSYGRWFYFPWNGPQEADFRTPRLVWPDRSASVPAGGAAIYTHTLENPAAVTQVFTLSAASSCGYTVTITPAITLTARERQVISATLHIPATAVGARDVTTLTVVGRLSGYDVVYDVTTVAPATGISTVKTAPQGTFSPTKMRPSCASTASLQKANPRPICRTSR